jgi:hypothetical protein
VLLPLAKLLLSAAAEAMTDRLETGMLAVAAPAE